MTLALIIVVALVSFMLGVLFTLETISESCFFYAKKPKKRITRPVR